MKNSVYLWRNHAPLKVISNYLTTSRRRDLSEKYSVDADAFRAFAKTKRFTQDWFTSNVPFWMEIFDLYGLRKGPVRAMEIGSFEGLSACFVLSQLPLASLTCVDTWGGSDEHAGIDISSMESAFDHNTSDWRDRLVKIKAFSFRYLSGLTRENKFDLIYVDGSHHADDVMVDAVRSFEQLKVGGVMILDDYLWRYYPRETENPAQAINGFLRLVEGRYELIMVYWQLAIIKTAERSA